MVVVYKESAINWHTLGRLITIDHYGLVNLVAGKRIVTELMQSELNGARLASELIALLDNRRTKKFEVCCMKWPISLVRVAHRGGPPKRSWDPYGVRALQAHFPFII